MRNSNLDGVLYLILGFIAVLTIASIRRALDRRAVTRGVTQPVPLTKQWWIYTWLILGGAVVLALGVMTDSTPLWVAGITITASGLIPT